MKPLSKPAPFLYDPRALSKMLQHTAVSLRRARHDGDDEARIMYRMENRLVYAFRWEAPSDEDPQDTLRRPDNGLMLATVQEPTLYERMVDHVAFAKVDGNGNAVDMVPPRTLAKDFIVAKHHWRFDVLSGLIQAPTLRTDGTVLQDHGYDKKSGLYLDTSGVEFPKIPENPTKEEAKAALAVLKEPFAEFPFVKIIEDFDEKSPSLSVALSAVLTGLIRRSLRAAPLHGFDASEAGSGKGLAANTVSIIVTGHEAPMMNFATNDTEFRKALFAALLENHAVICFDNVAAGRPLEGETLCTALAETTMEDRILGVSQMAKVPTNALFMATGNNLSVRGDMQRRIIGARIEAGEHPERRTFKRRNLLQWVRENRPELVAAGLTVLRAYEAAGRPAVPVSELGSYEEWSARVRAALLWLGEADPVLTQEGFMEADPERETLATVLRALHSAYGAAWFRARDVAGSMYEDVDGGVVVALYEAGVPTDARGLGTFLTKYKGRTVNGLRLDTSKDTHADVSRFRVVKAR